MRAVVLAGGRGTRLAPYTTLLPKALMPIGDMAIVELLVRRLSAAGIERVTLAVGHLASLIRAYFSEVSDLKIELDYSLERRPLGTAGPLSLVDGLHESFLVMNGDLLTDLDFRALVDAHKASEAVATVGTYYRDVRLDLGVVEEEGGFIVGYQEKPSLRFLVSMGVYVFEPAVLELLPPGLPFELPDLVNALLKRGRRVSCYQHDGYWLDIGRPDDYERAQHDFEAIKHRLLPQRR